MSLTLNSKVSEIPGVGESYAQKLHKLGLSSVRDLLFYFPRRWDDFSKITPIAEVRIDETVSVKGTIFDIVTKKSRKGTAVTELVLTDETGSLKAVWFNQPFLERTFRKGEEIFLAGKLEWSYGQVSMCAPAWEKVQGEGTEDLRHVGRIVPVYAETAGLSSKWLRAKIAPLAKLVYSVKDYLPDQVKRKHNLMELPAAVRSMHYPENFGELQKASERVKFDGLFCLLLSVLSNRQTNAKEKSVAVSFDEKTGKKFVSSLPYELTNSQRKAAWEISKDLGNTSPMNRLLEGDVGSGKTVVAAMAAAMVATRGYQTAIIAPTEILARQHYAEFKSLLSDFQVEVALLTGSTKPAEKKEILSKIADNEISVVIGTHALLTDAIKYWTLALVVIDEQHRFGVEQRMLLKKANGVSGVAPHFLSMSATPIPRTLAITVFGDLDISVLTEMPPGRKQVSTHLIPPEKRQDGYKFIGEKINEGRQVFVICPLISESDKLGVKSATQEVENLRKNVFPKYNIGLLHGKMKAVEKENVMKDFAAGKLDILVSTSVIEVGINVPNAAIMVVEGAERFGLAQLHQFRGRVGRGKHQSFCFLFANTWNEITQKRLEALVSTKNGFELAEKDLELRGPGELLGISQHGKIDDTLLTVIKDPLYIASVRKTAQLFLDSNKISDYPLLAEKVAEYNFAAKLE